MEGQDDRRIHLSLLCVGELGRQIDLGQDADPVILKDLIVSCFDSSFEATKSAAAYALGHLAVGEYRKIKFLKIKIRCFKIKLRFYSIQIRFLKIKIRCFKIKIRFYSIKIRFYKIQIRFFKIFENIVKCFKMF